MGLFVQGSGWGWLAAKKETGKLFVITAPNQDTVQHVAPVRPHLLLWPDRFLTRPDFPVLCVIGAPVPPDSARNSIPSMRF